LHQLSCSPVLFELVTYRNVNDTPDASFAIFFEHALYFIGFRQIAVNGIDFCAVFILLGGVFWKSVPCDLGNAI